MDLEIAAVVTGQVAEITLRGVLDAKADPEFRQVLERVAAGKPSRLVLRVRGLVLMASAGVRSILLVRQQFMGPEVTIYVIAPGKEVLDTLRRTGLIHMVVIQDEYPGAG